MRFTLICGRYGLNILFVEVVFGIFKSGTVDVCKILDRVGSG
jgi:hypothetical protein